MSTYRYLRFLILFGIIIFFAAGCRYPVITFPSEDITINVGDSISFNAESYHNALYWWTFDGGAKDVYVRNPTVRFDREGAYNVCLTVLFGDLESGITVCKVTVVD